MKLAFYFIVLGMFQCSFVNAQIDTDDIAAQFTVPEVILVDLEPGTTILLSPASVIEAGNALNNSTNNSTWLNYTSCVSPSETRNITVQLDTALSSGVFLQLEVAAFSGIGAGTLGTQIATPVALSTSPQNIITGIGGAYTGNGTGNGFQLTYTLGVTDFSQIQAGSTNIGITYTITNL